jgi:two-component system alkaline phosphatase synthesis response regulator PhoP
VGLGELFFKATMANKILLIEDDSGITMALTDLLNAEDYSVETVADGLSGLACACEGDFDMIILDVMLPGKNGFDVCRDLRQRSITTPILMLTARGQVIDKVLGLKLGADDYLCKPFEPPELLARLEALLRRSRTTASAADLLDSFSFGSVTVNFRSIEVHRNGKQVEISAREFQLLSYFIAQRGATLSRDELLREVWGYDTATLTRTVDVHVGWLRQKLEDDAKEPRHFLTMRGHGYKFVA